MVAVLDSYMVVLRNALRGWWRASDSDDTCRSCGADVEAPLEECLSCLRDRHW